MPGTRAAQSREAFAAYEAVRGRLPAARPAAPAGTQILGDLSEIAERFDVFFMDAFGVLNVGERAIPGARERVEALSRAGKRVVVISNAASYPKRVLLARYRGLGFDFADDQVISSRETLLGAMESLAQGRHFGVMLPATHGREELEALDFDFLEDDPAVYSAAEGFILLGSGEWSEARQRRLEAAIGENPRPVFVGNPDIVAPREAGLSREPGYFAHRLADRTGISPVFFGKPFPAIFEAAIAALPAGTDLSRVVMLGDTLHTDILGAQAAGIASALVTGFGTLCGLDPAQAAAQAGIVPDFSMHSI